MITAVLALRKTPYVDPDRVGLLGRSMGGGIVYNALVTKPGLVDAAVVDAPVSSLFVDNLDRWTRPERPDVAAQVFDRLGRRPGIRTPTATSSRTFFDRISEPLLIHHGTADESCPIRWSRATLRALQRSDRRPAGRLPRRAARLRSRLGAVDAADGPVLRAEPVKPLLSPGSGGRVGP